VLGVSAGRRAQESRPSRSRKVPSRSPGRRGLAARPRARKCQGQGLSREGQSSLSSTRITA